MSDATTLTPSDDTGIGAAPRSDRPYPREVSPPPIPWPTDDEWSRLTPTARVDLACELWADACERRHQHAPMTLTPNQHKAAEFVVDAARGLAQILMDEEDASFTP